MKLYAIPTHKCNLTCPHCHLKDEPEVYNRDLFLEKLNTFGGSIILFGGEPTVNRERMFDVVNSNRENGVSKIASVATNLMILDDELLSLYSEIGSISTSWNRTRFTDAQYKQWLKHCDMLEGTDIDTMIIITLTDDLLSYDMDEFLKVVDQWNPNAIDCIKFEHYIGSENTPEYYQRADEWLCKLYNVWRSGIQVQNFNPNIKYYFNCNDTFTLEPSGVVHNSCPNGVYVKPTIVSKCLTCERANVCRPCKLQQDCSCPIELRKLIESEV